MTADVFGNYRVISKLGSGSMGTVFLAEHQRIARRAAIKVLSPELAASPEVLRRFFNEALATSLIHHPGIVEVLDCGVDPGGRPYIVMEHLEGETLAAQLARVGRVGWRRACATARQIADGLSVAHRRGIVHRDLKPENVFVVAGTGAIKVLDFGIAKLLHESQSMSRTHPGKLLGTPEYMAPEQCGDAGQVDARTDVYALGCLLFETMCGQPPFVEQSLGALIVAHTTRTPPRASSQAPGVPPALDRLVARMLAKDPAGRPQDMAEVGRALGALLAEGEDSGVVPMSQRSTVARVDAALAAPAAAAGRAWSWTARGRLELVAASLGVAAIAGTAIAVVRARGTDVAPAPASPSRPATSVAAPVRARAAVPAPPLEAPAAPRAAAPPPAAPVETPASPPPAAPVDTPAGPPPASPAVLAVPQPAAARAGDPEARRPSRPRPSAAAPAPLPAHSATPRPTRTPALDSDGIVNL